MPRLGLGLILDIVLMLGVVGVSTNSSPCSITLDGTGRLSTLCETPYCTCNNPYGRVYCSCRAPNSSYPQISELTIRTTGPCRLNQEVQDLVLEDCTNVTFTEKAFAPLRSLRSIQVTNVREVNIQKHAFHWNASSTEGLRVRLTNTTVADLPSFAFSGSIYSIVFRKVYIGLIHSFAFSSTNDIDRLQFVDCDFANVEQQSFKKFTTNQFIIEGSRFNAIPSRFLIEVHVKYLFRLDSNLIDVIRTLAFQVSQPTDVTISKNRIDSIDGEAFSIQTRGRVSFEDNIINSIGDGAFRGISALKKHSSNGPMEFIFKNNSLGTFKEGTLAFDPSFHVIFSRLLIDDTCSCENLVLWRNTLYPSQKNDRGPIEPHLTKIWCHEESTKEFDFEFMSGETFYQEHCTAFFLSIYFFVIIIVATTVCLSCVIIVIIVVVRRRRKWDMVPTSDVRGVEQTEQKPTIIVPDGRVYRETEFHVIVEKAEPLEEVVPFRVARDRSRTSFGRDGPN